MADSCQSNSLIMEKKIEIQRQIINNCKMQVAYSDSIINQHKYVESLYKKQIADKDKEIKRLKVKGGICIGVAILTTIIAIWR